MIQVNIGLARPDGKPDNTPEQVFRAMAAERWTVYRYSVKRSATEDTLVAEVDASDNPNSVWRLSVALAQDCVAWRDSTGAGHLTGPKADAWGAFNPDFWIAP